MQSFITLYLLLAPQAVHLARSLIHGGPLRP